MQNMEYQTLNQHMRGLIEITVLQETICAPFIAKEDQIYQSYEIQRLSFSLL